MNKELAGHTLMNLCEKAISFTSSVTLLSNRLQIRFFLKDLVLKSQSWHHHYLCAHREVTSPPCGSPSANISPLGGLPEDRVR